MWETRELYWGLGRGVEGQEGSKQENYTGGQGVDGLEEEVGKWDQGIVVQTAWLIYQNRQGEEIRFL